MNELIKDENFQVVIVDDTVEHLELLSDILTNEGYLVRSFDSGEFALRSIKENQPSLVLLDILMPVMDGFDVCRQLKADENTCNIPVIFISGSGDKESMLAGFQVGGVDFISKPFQKEEILARVRTHISLFQLQVDLNVKNQKLEQEIRRRQQIELVLTESEDRFRTTLYSIGDGVITTDAERKVRLMNPVAEQLTGWSQTDAAGKILEEVFPIINEETRAQVEIPVRKVLREGVIVGLANHTLLIAKDGTERPIADSGSPIRNKNGEIVGVVLVFQDQTEQRKAEKRLLESEFFFRESQRAAYLGSYKFDLATGFWDSSDVLDRIFGIDKEYVRDVEGWKDLIHTDDLEMMDKHLSEDVLGERKPFNKEYRIVRKSDGKIRWVNGLGQLNLDAEGNILSLIGTIQDITKRKRTDDVLKESEEKFRSLFEDATVGISMTNIDGTMLINRHLHEMLGYTEEGFRNKRWQEITHPDDIQESANVVKTLLDGKAERLRFEKRYLNKNGDVIWTDVSTTLHRDSNDNPLYFITSINDITKRKEAEESLRKNEQKFRALIENSSDAISLVDASGLEFYHSSSCQQILGYSAEERNGKSMMELIHPDERDSLIGMFTDILKNPGIATLMPTRVRHKNGSWLWIEGIANNLLADPDIQAIVINFRDVTERRNAEQALFESEEMMRNSQSVAHSCSYSTNLNENEPGASSWICSPEFYKIFGIDKTYPHTIEGWAGFIHPDYREEMVAYHEYVIKERIPFEHEYKIVRISDGVERWVYSTGKLEFDNNGNPVRMHGAIQDITERKMDMEAIQNERQLLRTLIDHLPDPIYVKDNQGRKMLANRADLENIGVLKESDVLGKSDLELFNTETGYRGYEDDLIVIENGKPIINREKIFVDKNGEKRWLLTTKIPIYNANGKTSGLVGIGRDITEQKKANETIQKLSKSIEQSPSTIVITDVLGNIEYVNPKFIEITGYSYEEAVGQNPRMLKSGEMSPEKYKELWDIISSGGVWRGEFHNRRKNGEMYWEWATMTSIKDEYGIITNYIAIKEDISIRKQMEADLIIAKDKAEESDRLKSAFLANMSHEIRTPLNSIIGFSELLDDADFEVDQKKEFVHHIISNGNNLLNIISDIMDISKMESGEITIRKSKVDVMQFLDEIRSMHIYKVEQKNLRLDLDCLHAESNQAVLVNADKERLQQIFNNMISNALKFTSEGYIQIGCRLIGEMVEFHVKDTGIGIPADYHHKVFDRFRQVEASYTRKFGGNGLGLAISKNLVELMGGKIWVESEHGNGSTFYFTLPLFQ
ncbi:MAG: PAS domain S-box protein [Bacteroidota bacterium]|nr:PAS domain S-box protein [Bacteroidota bacterium]